MTAREIEDARRALETLRRDKVTECMTEFDAFYRRELRALQDACGRIGHCRLYVYGAKNACTVCGCAT